MRETPREHAETSSRNGESASPPRGGGAQSVRQVLSAPQKAPERKAQQAVSRSSLRARSSAREEQRASALRKARVKQFGGERRKARGSKGVANPAANGQERKS